MNDLLPWMNPEYLLATFGPAFFWVGVVIVFIECGLLFPILPGDSLLFAIGLFIHQGIIPMPLWTACLILSAAAFAGNVAGYEIGRVIGPTLYARDGRFLKRKYFDQTVEFFDKYGSKALVIGRFVPIVRTFITVVAGVGKMPRRRFFTWSAVGAVLWAIGIILVGYFLGQIPVVHENLEIAVLLIVAVSVVPMLIEYSRHQRRARRAARAEAPATPTGTGIASGTVDPTGTDTPTRRATPTGMADPVAPIAPVRPDRTDASGVTDAPDAPDTPAE